MLEWQPLTWHIFHTIALNYNSEYKEQYITFFNSIKNIIPCKDFYNAILKQMSNLKAVELSGDLLNFEKIIC